MAEDKVGQCCGDDIGHPREDSLTSLNEELSLFIDIWSFDIGKSDCHTLYNSYPPSLIDESQVVSKIAGKIMRRMNSTVCQETCIFAKNNIWIKILESWIFRMYCIYICTSKFCKKVFISNALPRL